MRLILALVLTLVLLNCTSVKNTPYLKNELWTFISTDKIRDADIKLPDEYLALVLNSAVLEEKLRQSDSPNITLPDINHSFITVKLEDSGTMSPELRKKFPNIRSYTGIEIGKPSNRVRVDKNTTGLFAMTVRDGQTYFLNPVEKGSTTYIVYDKKYAVKGSNPFIDQVIKK